MFVWTTRDVGFFLYVGVIVLGLLVLLLLAAYYCIRAEVLKIRDRLRLWFKRAFKREEADGT